MKARIQALLQPATATTGKVIAIKGATLHIATAQGLKTALAVDGIREGDQVTLRDGRAEAATKKTPEVYYL